MVTSIERLNDRADLYQSVWNFGVCDKIFIILTPRVMCVRLKRKSKKINT